MLYIKEPHPDTTAALLVEKCEHMQVWSDSHECPCSCCSTAVRKAKKKFLCLSWGVCVCVCVCVLKCVVFERVCPSERKVILPVSVCPAAGRRSEGLLVDTCVGASHTVVGWTFLRMCVCLCDVLIHVNYIYRHHVKGKQKPTRKSRKLDRNA